MDHNPIKMASQKRLIPGNSCEKWVTTEVDEAYISWQPKPDFQSALPCESRQEPWISMLGKNLMSSQQPSHKGIRIPVAISTLELVNLCIV